AFVELWRDSCPRSKVGRLRFAKYEEGDEQRDERQRSGSNTRQKIAGHSVLRAEVRQESAERRPEDEAHPEGRSNNPHSSGAILRRGLVSDVGLRGADVRAARA